MSGDLGQLGLIQNNGSLNSLLCTVDIEKGTEK